MDSILNDIKKEKKQYEEDDKAKITDTSLDTIEEGEKAEKQLQANLSMRRKKVGGGIGALVSEAITKKKTVNFQTNDSGN